MMKSLYSMAIAFALATSTFYVVRGQEDVRSRSSVRNSEASESGSTNLAAEDQKLISSTRSLMGQYKKASQDQKLSLEKQLREVVTKHFKVRQQMRDQEIDRLTARISELKQLQQRRESQSDKIVEDQLQHLIREADGLGWGGAESHAHVFNFAPNDLSADAAPLSVEILQPLAEVFNPVSPAP